MRWLCLILSFLVLGLSVQPACAAFSLLEAQVSVSDDCCPDTQPASESSSKKDCHGCNPFHSCSCCVASVLLPFSLKVSPPAALSVPAAPISRYQTATLPNVSFDFWQPPRLL